MPATCMLPAIQQHAALLQSSYTALLGEALLELASPTTDLSQALWQAPFAIVSHDTAADPIFNYANRCALQLFEFEFAEFITLPSRFSAEAINREARAQLLAEVSQKGYINNYAGVRISKTGKRFLIQNAVVWNIFDHQQRYCGQAACFKSWEYL